jgi:hypothetical protein
MLWDLLETELEIEKKVMKKSGEIWYIILSAPTIEDVAQVFGCDGKEMGGWYLKVTPLGENVTRTNNLPTLLLFFVGIFLQKNLEAFFFCCLFLFFTIKKKAKTNPKERKFEKCFRTLILCNYSGKERKLMSSFLNCSKF